MEIMASMDTGWYPKLEHFLEEVFPKSTVPPEVTSDSTDYVAFKKNCQQSFSFFFWFFQPRQKI